jgi:plasmid maintenance system killer protein
MMFWLIASFADVTTARHIRVNDQYRITFRFREDSAHDVRCEDYHPHG